MLTIAKMLLCEIGQDRVGHRYVRMSARAEILDVRALNGAVVLSLRAERNASDLVQRHFAIARSGQEVPREAQCIASFDEGGVVFHVFEWRAFEDRIRDHFGWMGVRP